MKNYRIDRKAIWMCIFLFLLFWPMCRSAAMADEFDEEMIFIDAANDQKAYGELVARLNRLSEEMSLYSADPDGEPVKLHTVLCRSTGEAVDFSPWQPVYALAGPRSCYTLYFESKDMAAAAVQDLSALPNIRYAEPDAEVSACAAADRSFYSWSAERMNFGAYLDYAEPLQQGSVTVALIDSGVFLHPQFADRVLESGYDYVDADEDSMSDLFGHGTNVAGIITDCTPNAPVYLYPIRVLNASGNGSISNVVNGIREAAEKGVRIINLSLSTKVMSEAMDEAILDAVSAGITVIVAAGNNGIESSQVCPAHMQDAGVIVVGSAELDGGRSPYSNYGASVDVYAYGTGISCCSRSGGYTLASGTSMAAPHITALSAILLLLHPELTPAEIEARIAAASIERGGVPVPDLMGMIPQENGIHLDALRLTLTDPLNLPAYAIPRSSMECIRYSSDNEEVVELTDGVLNPVGAGTAVVTAACFGLPERSFLVEVIAEQGGELLLPASLTEIADEAFIGCGASCVRFPEGVQGIGSDVLEECPRLCIVELPGSLDTIGCNTFSFAVILCSPGSTGEAFALELDLPYLLCQP